MTGESILVIDCKDDATNALVDTVANLGWRLNPRTSVDFDVVLKAVTAIDDQPTAIVIGPHSDSPLLVARQIFRADPLVQMIFLADSLRAMELRREMGLAPRIGTYWSIIDAAGLARILPEAVRSTQQRRRMRTTLDKVKLQIPSRQAKDGIDYRRLVMSDYYLASVLAHAQDAILSTDPTGIVLTWNQAATRMFGQNSSDAVGRPISHIAVKNGFNEIESMIRSICNGESEVRREIRLRRNDESELQGEAMSTPVRDDLGNLLIISAIIRDVSDRKRAEAVLLAVQRELHAEATASDGRVR